MPSGSDPGLLLGCQCHVAAMKRRYRCDFPYASSVAPLLPAKPLPYVLILAIGQIVGWGMIGLLPVVGSRLASDLLLPLPVIFAGTSTFYVVSGLCAPLLAGAFSRWGARPLLIAGSVLMSLGFVLLAHANGAAIYFLSWLVLGAAGAASLSTAAYIALNDALGARAKGAIGALMLVTGLSSSVFWPATAWLDAAVGWRSASLIYAVAALGCAVLYSFFLPSQRQVEPVTPTSPNSPTSPDRPSTFYLLALAIALNAFVTFGLAAVLIEVLRSFDMPDQEAVAMASLLGIVQVSARGLDFLGGGRWDGLTTGLVAGLALPLGLAVLLVAGSSSLAIIGFLLIYGLGSGALAVSRATMPLVFYSRAEYARAASRIALPLNLLAASAPPILVALLGKFGAPSVLMLAIVFSVIAFALLLALKGRRPATH